MAKAKKAERGEILKIELLQKPALFRGLQPDELAKLAASSALQSFNDGEAVFCHGEEGDALYIVKKGAVRIVDPKTDPPTDIARFIEGELFGEMDLFEEAPRSFDALAEGTTELLVLPKPGLKFESLLSKETKLFSRILTRLLSQIANRIREANRLVSEKAPWLEELKHQLYYDKLTGLYNKTYFDEEFSREIQEHGEGAAFLAVKPDNFKLINDGYGHEAGDKVLSLLANTLAEQAAPDGQAFRLRGDELFIVLKNKNRAATLKLAREILASVKQINLAEMVGDWGLQLTVSLGIAFYPSESFTPAQVLDLAVKRMFLARQAGGDRLIGEEGDA